MRNKIARKNRQTLLAWNNLFWLSMMLLTGFKFRQIEYWEAGWGFILTFIEIVTMLLVTTDKVVKLDYFKLSFIEPVKVGIGIFLISQFIKWLF